MFSSAPKPPIVIEQKPAPPCQQIQLNKNYLCPLGLLRILIMLVLLGGNLSAWGIPKNIGLFNIIDGIFGSTRSGYIVWSSISIFLSVLIFVFSVSNFVNLPGVRSVYWLILFIAADVFCLLGMFCMSVTAGVREAQLPSNYFNDIINQGAFASAAAFGLVAVILYILTIAIAVPFLMKLLEPD